MCEQCLNEMANYELREGPVIWKVCRSCIEIYGPGDFILPTAQRNSGMPWIHPGADATWTDSGGGTVSEIDPMHPTGEHLRMIIGGAG